MTHKQQLSEPRADTNQGGPGPDEVPAPREAVPARRQKSADLIALERRMGFFNLLMESTGFHLVPIPPDEIEPGTLGWRTNYNTREICFNPETFELFPGNTGMHGGLLAHEAGHHHSFTKRMDLQGFQADLRRPPLLPEHYDDNSFLLHLRAGLIDVVDEAVVGRYPYALIKADLDALNTTVSLDVEERIGRTVEGLGGKNRPRILANLLPAAVYAFIGKGNVTDDFRAKANDFIEKAMGDEPAQNLDESAAPEVRQLIGRIENVLTNWENEASLSGQEKLLMEQIRLDTVGGLKRLPKPEQYVQLLLSEARYPTGYALDERVDQDVAEAYRRTVNGKQFDGRSAMEVMQDMSFFQKPFLREQYEDQAFHAKMETYEDVFRAEYIGLVEAEIQKRALEQMMQQQQGDGQGEGGQGQGKGDKKGQGQSRGGMGRSGGMPSSVPPTKQEREMMKKQLKEMLEKAIDDALNDDGKKKPGQGQPVEVPGMPAKPGQKGKPQGKPMQVPKGMLEDIAKDLKDKLDALAEKYKSMSQRDEDDKRRRGQKVEGGRPQGRGPDFFDMLRDAARNLAQQQKAGKCAGVGTKYGVPPEVVAEYFEIRDRRAGVIEQLTEELTEPFRDNRRSIIRHNKREGNWTPGLEGETVGEMMSGNLEPETMMKQDENPDFAKTEVEFVVDTSGSMGGGPLRACREMQVVAMESLEGVRDRLAGEDLLRPKQEIPLKMGSCMLDSEYHPIHNKDEDLDEHAKIHIVHILSTAGGGTDVHHTTEKKYQEFNTGDPNTIKIMVLMSDHFTEATTMAKLVEQIRRDNTIIFLALGFGSDAESIAKIYGDAAAEAGATNVFAKAFPENEIESATPWVARFLVDQVTPRVEQMTSKFRGY